jgi:hypothetical protein
MALLWLDLGIEGHFLFKGMIYTLQQNCQELEKVECYEKILKGTKIRSQLNHGLL